jgi:plasmid stabilization system protein ParE
MAFRVEWTSTALADLESIGSYIERDSSRYAQVVVRGLFGKASGLGAFPESGRRVSELSDPDLREVFLYSYRIIYKIKNGSVIVLGILHGRQDFLRHFPELDVEESNKEP